MRTSVPFFTETISRSSVFKEKETLGAGFAVFRPGRGWFEPLGVEEINFLTRPMIGKRFMCTKPELDLDRAGEIPCTDSRQLQLNFRKAPLYRVLNYLHEAGGLSIEVERNVEIERTIELWNEQPVAREEAIRMLTRALDQNGYATIRKGSRIAITTRQDAKKRYIPLPVLGCAFANDLRVN